MKYIIFLFLIFSLLMVNCFQCKESSCPDELVYEVPTNIVAKGDTIEIGDTISISCSFPETLLDINNGIENTFKDFNFQFVSSLTRMDIEPNILDCASYFDVVPITGKIFKQYPESSIYTIDSIYYNQSYAFKYLLIAKGKGTFLFGHSSFTTLDPQTAADPPQNCKGAKLIVLNRINEGRENGYFMIADNKLRPYAKNILLIREKFDEGAFCFVVK